jgi:alpha-tubulin suppressor-like RCC1 family protein
MRLSWALTLNSKISFGLRRCFSSSTVSKHIKYQAFSYGQGYLGTLGGSDFVDVPVPKPIPALLESDVGAVDCGWGHSAFLSRDGKALAVCGRPLDFRNTLRNISIRKGGLTFVQTAMNELARFLFPSDIGPQITLSSSILGNSEDLLVHLVCGKGGLTGLVSRSGRAYVFGGNKFGQCGVGVPPQVSGSDVISLPLPDSTSSSTKMSHVAGIDENEGIVCLALGLEHGLAVTNTGNLYSWGRGDRGQLGHAQSAAHLFKAVCVMGPSFTWAGGHRIVAAQAGASQSAAIDIDGRLWVWGKMNSLEQKEARADGYLMRDQIEPRLVTFPDEEIDGIVTNQLIDNSASDINVLKKCLEDRDVGNVLTLEQERMLPVVRADTLRSGKGVVMGVNNDIANGKRKRKVSAVSISQAHTSILTDDGRMWQIGLRGRGILFDTESSESPDPQLPEVYSQTSPLEIDAGPLKSLSVIALRSGLHHTLALTECGRVFRWGWKGVVRELTSEELGEIANGGRIVDLSLGYCHTVLLAKTV